MNRVPALCLLAAVAAGTRRGARRGLRSAASRARRGAISNGRRSRAEAKKLLSELQWRIESFQFGPSNVELAKKLVAADPNFAIGQYYLSAVLPDPAEAEKQYEKSRELAKTASEGRAPLHRGHGAGAPQPGRGLREVHPVPGGPGRRTIRESGSST